MTASLSEEPNLDTFRLPLASVSCYVRVLIVSGGGWVFLFCVSTLRLWIPPPWIYRHKRVPIECTGASVTSRLQNPPVVDDDERPTSNLAP